MGEHTIALGSECLKDGEASATICQECDVLTSRPLSSPFSTPVCPASKEARSANGTRTLSNWAVAMRARWLAPGRG